MTTDGKNGNSAEMTPLRALAAVLVGLIGAVFVWMATPYVDIVINCNSRAADMSDGYMPSGVTSFVLFLVLLVNPLLYRFARRFALSRAQLAIAFGMMLVGGYMGGDGLMRRLPYNIIGTPVRANQSQKLSEIFQKLNLPPSLFAEKLEYGAPTPHGDHFIDELPPLDPLNPDGPKQPTPWGIWLKPLISWGVFLLSGWLLMLGLTQMLIPQWRDNERLPFPLLQVQRALIETPEPGTVLAPLFRQAMFWVPVILVFLIRVPFYIERYWPGRVPVISLEWNIADCFTEGALRYLPYYIKSGYIFFIIVGISFFMRTRITFSVWFFAVAYAFYEMICSAYMPPFKGAVVGDNRDGAMMGMTIAVLWLGKRHFLNVAGLLFRRPTTGEDRLMKNALLMFLSGCAGVFGWLCWLGTGPLWALFFVVMMSIVALVTTRLVAETGLPYSQAALQAESFMFLAPASWITPVAAWFAPIFTTYYSWASVANPAAHAAHAFQLDETASPERKWGFSKLLIITLAIGVVVCGGTHIYGSYHHSVTMDGLESPLNPYFFNQFNASTGPAEKILDGVKPTAGHNRPMSLAFGAALAGVLEWASLSHPGWFLHPIGLLVLQSWYINRIWVSIFIGWLLKVLIMRYGGGRMYRQVTPFFVGLIVGDVISLIFWGLVPAVLIFCGIKG